MLRYTYTACLVLFLVCEDGRIIPLRRQQMLLVRLVSRQRAVSLPEYVEREWWLSLSRVRVPTFPLFILASKLLGAGASSVDTEVAALNGQLLQLHCSSDQGAT